MDRNRENFLAHARFLILALYTNLYRIFGRQLHGDFPESVCGYELTVDAARTALEHKVMREFFNGCDLYTWFQAVYRYGIDGIEDNLFYPEDDTESCIPFWDGFKHMSSFMHFNTDKDVDTSFEVVNAVVQKYWCRYKLDGGSGWEAPKIDGEPTIFLTDLAVLADLDEKTIRNMASKRLEGFPQSFKQGNRTCVSNREARAWLVSRGWKDTVTSQDLPAHYQLPDSFLNAEHVSEVLQNSVAWAVKNLSRDASAQRTWEQDLQSRLAESSLDLPLSAIESWANFIATNSFDLAYMIQSLRHRIEATALARHFNQI